MRELHEKIEIRRNHKQGLGFELTDNVFSGRIHFELAKDTRCGNSKCQLSSYCAEGGIEHLHPPHSLAFSYRVFPP